MMPATNNGAGQNIGFPDVCLTPAAPAPIPIPYPNIAMHAMAVPFSPNVRVGFMPALNMASKIPMTMGDEGGVAHPLFKQMGQFTIGNPLVFVNCVPAVNLLIPTTGNMMNNPIGAVLVPSVTVTFFTDAAARDATDEAGSVDMDVLAWLQSAQAGVRRGEELERTGESPCGVRVIRIDRVTSDAGTRVFRALQAAQGNALIVDLRGNRGGDAQGARRVLDHFVEDGVVLMERHDLDGDSTPWSSRGPALFDGRIAVLVDELTASAAELIAAGLRAHAGAIVVGRRTAGKATAQTLSVTARGAGKYETTGSFTVPGESVEGGLEPDVFIAENECALEAARAVVAA